MIYKNASFAAFVVFTALITGCSGKKDASVKPTVTWIIDGPILAKDEVFKKEISEWFSPYKIQNICAGMRIYPQINIIRLDKPGETVKLLAIDPKTLSSGNQNFVQKIFGAKPKFEKLEELAKSEIEKLKINESLKKEVLEKEGAIDFSNINSAKYSAMLIKFAGQKSERTDFVEKSIPISNKKNIISVDNDALKFKTAMATILCGDDTKKIHEETNFILVDVDRQKSGVAVPRNSASPASGDTVVNVKPGEQKIIPAKPGGNVTVNVESVAGKDISAPPPAQKIIVNVNKQQSEKGITPSNQSKQNKVNDEDDFIPGQKHTKPIANPQSH